ncbi:MAG: N-acetyltransferase [Actinomycetota bacterium]|nr:MAG: N-acetyltransferase [Actinomycetota bacterium]
MLDERYRDSRPHDAVWPDAGWPPPGGPWRGTWVELTPAVAADSAELFAATDHDEVWRHTFGRPVDADGWVAVVNAAPAAGRHPWTVRLRRPYAGLSPGTVVGTSSYLEISVHDARLEIGATAYAPAVWGGPVNPETKLLLLTVAFEELRMGRVQLKTDVRNVRSLRAIERLGATPEGVLRRYQRRSDGTVRDTALFSVVAEDWPRVRSGLRRRLAAFG